MSYRGDINLDSTIDIKFCTVTTTGAPTQLAGTPVISAYPDNSITQLTAGITLTVDFDTVTGLNNIRVVATGANGYATATNYDLVITTGTVGGTSVVGYVVGSFSIEKRSALRPTTASRTLDVTATGEAGIDWANIGGPTTAQTLSGTAVNDVTTKTGYALSAAGIQAIWDALTSALTTVGSIGKRLVDYITGDAFARLGAPAGVSVSADIAAVKTDTVATLLDTGTDGVIVNTHTATGKAEINAEVVDVVNVDTIAELAQGIPTATPTMRAALMLMYMGWRNKLDVDASNKEIHNDAGTVICKKALTDDGTTYSEAEMISGP